jgi:type VI secretion system protein ImpC
MSMNFSFDHLKSTMRSVARERPEPEAPFRVLVIGDFSGRASRAVVEPLSARPARAVDINSLDAVLAAMDVRLALHAGSASALGLGFHEIDDFHPDALYRRIEVFGPLRTLRARLTNPASSAEAAQEIRAWSSAASSIIEPKPAEAPATPRSEFEALMGGRSVPTTRAAGLDALIRDLVRPHIVPSAEPDHAQLAEALDAAIGGLMRDVLHDPAFASLEANWRSIHELITRLELGDELTLSVLDASRAELDHDLRTAGGAGLMEALVERPRSTAGGRPYSLVCVLESFGANGDDAQIVGGLALAAHAAGAALLAGACPSLIGASSMAQQPRPEQWTQAPDAADAWALVRTMREAASVGLVLPRVLLRQPYHPRTNPIDAFAFVEHDQPAAHDALLWANASVLAAMVLAQSFTEKGWMLDIEAGGDIDGLPVVVSGTGVDAQALPCAEAWLTDTASQRLLEKGVIPVLSVQHRDAVRIPRLCSITGSKLAAAWG